MLDKKWRLRFAFFHQRENKGKPAMAAKTSGLMGLSELTKQISQTHTGFRHAKMLARTESDV